MKIREKETEGFCSMKNGKRVLILLLAVMMMGMLWTAGAAEEDAMAPLSVQDGMLQPVFTYTNCITSNYTNEGSDLLRFCVWVETDFYTDIRILRLFQRGPASLGRPGLDL